MPIGTDACEPRALSREGQCIFFGRMVVQFWKFWHLSQLSSWPEIDPRRVVTVTALSCACEPLAVEYCWV